MRADREGRPRRGERERVGGGAHGRASQMLPFDEQQVVVLSVPLGLLGLGGMVVSGAVPEQTDVRPRRVPSVVCSTSGWAYV